MKGKKRDSAAKGAGKMNRFREVAMVYPLATFFLTACIFSWALWGLMMASSRGLLPFSFPLNPSGSFGPAVAGFLIAWAHPGEGKLLLRSLLRWRISWAWYAVALLAPGLLWGVGLAIALAFGGTMPSPAAFGGLAWLPAYFLLILVLGGPLGEEPGWRGVALPRLLGRTNALVASLVLGVMWLVWHLPLFWLEGSSQEGSSIPLFAVAVVAHAVMFTWMYLRTGGNLFAAVLLHAGVNTTSWATGVLFPALEADARFQGIFVGVLAAAAVGLVLAQRDLFLTRMVPPGPPSAKVR